MKEKPGDKIEEIPSKIAQIEESPSKIAQTKSSTLTHATPEDKKSIAHVDVDNSPQSNLPKIVSVRSQNPHAKEFLSAAGSLWEQVDSSSQRRLSGEFNIHSGCKQADPGNSKTLASSHSGSNKCNSVPGQMRQNHGWQTSMVCLKARAPPPPSNVSEEDVLEEDEVKLLEFAANCNWEGAKKEILSRVAQCLTRGQYPQPRTMNVCEFVVEILPKAHQPSVIPAELRSKLPGQMYSIRVRVTRREFVKKEDTNSASQIIDLSESSPIKRATPPTPKMQHAISLVKNRNDITSLLDKQKQLMVLDTKISPEHRTTSSVGISGLGNLCMNSNPAGQQNTYVTCTTDMLIKPKIISVDTQEQLPTSTKKLNVKAKTPTFMKVCMSPSSKESVITISSSSDLKMATSTANHVTTPAITTNRRTNKLKKSPVKQTVTQVIVYPKNLPVQCLEIPGEKGMMKVFMGQEANKKLIAVPVPATEKDILSKPDGSSVVIVPVSGASQSKLVPILKGPQSASAQNKLRAVSPRQWLTTTPTSLLNLPARKVSTAALPASTKQADYITVSADAIKKYKAASSTKVLNSSDEMIMVFDAAHIKASQMARNASLQQTPKERIQIVYPDKEVINPLTPVSRDHILVKPAISKLHQQQSLINAPIDLTDESNDINNGEDNEMVKGATPDRTSAANSVKPTPSDVGNVKIPTRPKSSLIYSFIKSSPTSASSASNSFLKKDSADKGLKRSLLHTQAEELTLAKQRRISLDNSLNTDEDSNVSVNSGMNTHPTEAAPTGLQDQPTSEMSASLSTGSTDDVMIMLSSEVSIHFLSVLEFPLFRENHQLMPEVVSSVPINYS